MRRRNKILIGVAATLVVGAGVFFGFVPDMVAKQRNATHEPGPWTLDEAALARHLSLSVVDMHTDSLLWDRDLSVRGDYGHVDLPRLREAGVMLQGFTVVTKVPRGMSFEHNTGDSDSISALMFGQLRPMDAWFSLEARALDQARALTELESSQADFRIVRTRADLKALIKARKAGEIVVGAWLGLEGSHALEGDAKAVDRLFDAGYRMMAPVHFFDNQLGGSAHGAEKGGLTTFGRTVIERQEQLGIAVDLAHASPALIDDVLAMAKKPVLNSHTGVLGTCDSPRNLSDKQLKGIAATGGVIGIAFFEEAVCGKDVGAIVKAIQHAVKVAGIDHVGFGSDFDGAVAVPFDVTGLGVLTEALREAGFKDREIEKLAGENVLRALGKTLPK